MRRPSEWFFKYVEEIRTEGKPAEEQVCDTYIDGVLSKDMNRRLTHFRRARDLAGRVGNRRLKLFCDHWCAQCMMSENHDASSILAITIPAVVEARKPQFRDLPQRFCLQEDLLNAYLQIDPVGHAESIEEALGYLKNEVPDDLECRWCYRRLCSDYHLTRREYDEAWEIELATFAQIKSVSSTLADASRVHHTMNVSARLCNLASPRDDHESILDYAIQGEALAATSGHPDYASMFLYWQAAALKSTGRDSEAETCFVRARNTQLTQSLEAACYDPVTAYHELQGNFQLAFDIRGKQLAQLGGKGWNWAECQVRHERCKLARKMNKPDLLQTEADALREVAANLKQPEVITDELDELLDDE